MVDLGRRVELQMDVGQRGLQLAQHICVEPEVDVRVLAVDAVDLGELRVLVHGYGVLRELRRGERVRALLLLRLGKRAELAFHSADVRLVEIEVLDEVDLVAAAAHAAREIGELAEREEVVRLHQRHAILEIEPLACLDLLPNGSEGLQHVEDCQAAYLSRSTTACVSDSSSSR